MKKRKKPISLIVFASIFTLYGVIMVLYCFASFVDYDNTSLSIRFNALLRDLFFYSKFTEVTILKAIFVRLMFGIAQIFIGAFLFDGKKWAFLASRVLMIVGISFAVLNPFYSASFIFIAVTAYTPLIYYLFHRKTEKIIEDGFPTGIFVDKEVKVESRSLAVSMLSFFEIIMGLKIMKMFLWNPEVYYQQYIILQAFPLMAWIITGCFIYLTGLLTLYFTKAGRKLNLILSLFVLFMTCYFFLNYTGLFGKSYNPGFIIPLALLFVFSFFNIFLLTKPEIRVQFYSTKT